MKHLNKFNKAILLPAVINRVMNQLGIQRKFLQQYIHPVLEEAYRSNDGSLDQKDRDKINKYYGLAVPAILGEAFCSLRGTTMTHEERWASTAQGAMTGLFDDFFDKDYLDETSIEKMISGHDNSVYKKSNQRLFDICYQKALQYCPNKRLLQHTLSEVYKAQVESKKQEGHAITSQEIETITWLKGGSSLIFYRAAFTPIITAVEEGLLFNLGGLMQLSNDIFDVYKDRESGIRTLVTEATSISELRIFYRSRLHNYYNEAYQTGYDKNNVRRFLDILSIGIFSRCLVCLDQLQSNEKLTGGIFQVNEYSRKQLICDMDKKINMLRSAASFINDIP